MYPPLCDLPTQWSKISISVRPYLDEGWFVLEFFVSHICQETPSSPYLFIQLRELFEFPLRSSTLILSCLPFGNQSSQNRDQGTAGRSLRLDTATWSRLLATKPAFRTQLVVGPFFSQTVPARSLLLRPRSLTSQLDV